MLIIKSAKTGKSQKLAKTPLNKNYLKKYLANSFRSIPLIGALVVAVATRIQRELVVCNKSMLASL